MNLRSIQTILLSALGVAASSAVSLAGCGGSFDVPKDHFDGVDAFGYVSYWDKIADIDIGEDTPLPLVIGFKSNRESSSPYLGQGWVMPLLESYIVQTGENTFEIMKPTGYTSGFGRDPKNTTAIGGVKGWKGEIGSNTIKVWAPCGWSLTYTMGRLTEMGTPQGKRVIVKRDSNGLVEDITMDGKVLVKVLGGVAGRVEGLEVEGKRLAITLDEKPLIQSLQGKIVVAGKVMSLGKLTSDEKVLRTFEYGVEGALQPKMAVTDSGKPPRNIVWNPETRLIAVDGEWTYEVEPETGRFDNAAIARTNSKNEVESWHFSSTKGEENILLANGTRIIRRWFSSGKFAGMQRSLTHSLGGKTIFSQNWVYDEYLHLVREQIVSDGRVREISYSSNGEPDRVTQDGMPVFTVQHDSVGNARTINDLENGYVLKNDLSSDGAVYQTCLRSTKPLFRLKHKNGIVYNLEFNP